MNGPKFPRRTLLSRGLVALAGALGLVAVDRHQRADAEAVPSVPKPRPTVEAGTLRLYARGWRPEVQPTLPGRSAETEHVVGYADLLDAPDGVAVGRLCTNGFCSKTPFAHPASAAPTIELQTLGLKGGSIFGMGAAGLGVGVEQSYAIVGGTGEFTGARGMYTVRPTSPDSGSHGTLQFTLTLTSS